VKLAKGTPVYPLIFAAVVLLGVALYKSTPYPAVISAITLILALFYLLFFRDPERNICTEEICSPADGIVQFVKKNENGWHVAVFMNIYNVHVNRSPVAGKIVKTKHEPGSHIPAYDKDSERNERVIYDMETAYGRIKVVQIAGILARRIVPYAKDGDSVKKGEKIGLIRFGSRVDTYLPEDLLPVVKEGDRMRAGESPLAKLVKNGVGTDE